MRLRHKCPEDQKTRARPLPPHGEDSTPGAGAYVIDVHRGWATYEDAALDIHWVHVHRIDDGRIKEVENFAADQHLADAFFWRV